MSSIAQPQGYQRALGVAIEATFGAYLAPTQWWADARSTLKGSSGLEAVDYAVNEWDETHVTQRTKRPAGGINMPLFPGRLDEFCDLFAFKAEPNLNSASILEHHGTAFVKAHTGVVVARAEISAEINGDLMANLTCVSQDSDTHAAGTPNFTDLPDAYTFEEITIKRNTVALNYITGIRINIDHVLREDKFGSDGTLLRRGIPSRRRRITIGLPMDFEETLWYTDWQAGTELAIEIKATRGVNSITWAFARCVVEDGADPDQPEIEGETTVEPLLRAYQDGVVEPMVITNV